VYYQGVHERLALAVVSVFASSAAANSYVGDWPPGAEEQPTWYINVGPTWVVITDSLTKWVAQYIQERLRGAILTNPDSSTG
jgi:hypothetical protein